MRPAPVLAPLAVGMVATVVGTLAWMFSSDTPARESGTQYARPVAAVPAAVQPSGRRTSALTTTSGTGTVVDPSWVAQIAAKTGIPAPAVRAYAQAQLAKPTGCTLGWTTLAGIGWVESQHGTIGNRTLGDDGRSSSPILGPALDGSGAVAAVPATPASTALTGDPAWDHAIGPLQFITSTWQRWHSDGDGDGVADPQDLNDAALAAARYLCATGHNLATGSGWAAAIWSYDHAQSYVDAVYSAATTYAQRAG